MSKMSLLNVVNGSDVRVVSQELLSIFNQSNEIKGGFDFRLRDDK